MEIKFKVYDCVELSTPLETMGRKTFTLCTYAKNILGLFDDWQKTNPREASLTNTNSPIKKMQQTIYNEPKYFIERNRGISINAKMVKYTSYDKYVYITLEDDNIHGLIDGGHTYLVLKDALERGVDISNVCVKITLLVGIDNLNEAVSVADALNSSLQVKENSLQNAKKYYDVIKKVLENKPYASRISYKEIEMSDEIDEKTGNFKKKDIPVKDILSKLFCFDVDVYNDEYHNPVRYYNGKQVLFKEMEDEKIRNRINKLAPLLPKILELYDTIYKYMPSMYNECVKDGITSPEAMKGFGYIKMVTLKVKNENILTNDGKTVKKQVGKPVELYAINSTSTYSIPASMTYPILAAHRFLISYNPTTQKYFWSYDPIKFFKKYGKYLVNIVGEIASCMDSSSKLGSTTYLWSRTAAELKQLYNSEMQNAMINSALCV